MLSNLLIKDYALIENLQIEFGAGLNIITGETGAGKSILINALGLLLGDRANTEVVRKGTKKAVVEGTFDVTANKKVRKLLEEQEIEFGPELFLRREISLKGSNRCFINDTPVTLAFVQRAGDLLIDLHGQHDHQSLLKQENHILMLDEFMESTETLELFNSKKEELHLLAGKLNDLKKREAAIKEKRDLYEFQIKEIDSVNPLADEETKLEEDLKILENAEHLLEKTSLIYNGLYEDEEALYNGLVKLHREISDLSAIDNKFTEKEAEFNQAVALLEDVAEFVRSYRDNIEMDPEQLEEVRERLGAFSLLKKKYGGSIKSVIEYREKIGSEFDLAENFSGEIEKLEAEIETVRKELGKIAKLLSDKRRELAVSIKENIEKELTYLGIAESQFEVNIKQLKAGENSSAYIIFENEKYLFNNYGFDEIEFFVSTNSGEDPKPLVKVASGGEISRIMLALKSVLAKTDRLPLLVFDEIDTGVSGRIAQKVGRVMKTLAEFHQIIAITHLPQIAGYSDLHYTVEKRKEGDRVISNIRRLTEEEKVSEVAKLLGGEEITDATLNSARELMKMSS